MDNRMILGSEIESITLGKNKIKIKLKNGKKIGCKAVGSMNFTATIHYKESNILKEDVHEKG